MKQLTWLAAERRLCDGDSEDDPSSQEDEDEEDDEAKGEEPAEGRSFQTSLDKDMPSGDKTPRGRRSAGRGRGETVRRDDCAGRNESTVITSHVVSVLVCPQAAAVHCAAWRGRVSVRTHPSCPCCMTRSCWTMTR